jgi:hypothetical protein
LLQMSWIGIPTQPHALKSCPWFSLLSTSRRSSNFQRFVCWPNTPAIHPNPKKSRQLIANDQVQDEKRLERGRRQRRRNR